jgi:hypothetical protein
MRPSKLVRVFNPTSQKIFTSRKSAERYVSRGRARWLADGSVEFIGDDDDYRAASVAESIERQRQLGYDRDVSQGRRASFEAIKNLPICGDPVKLFTKQTRDRRARQRKPAPLLLHIRVDAPVAVAS